MGSKQISEQRTPPALLADCLVECDPALSRRAGQSRRKAVGFSVLTQGIAVGALILVPLFATGSKIVGHTIFVTVPYGGHRPDPAPQQDRNRGARPPAGREARQPHNKIQIMAPSIIPHNIDITNSAVDNIGIATEGENRHVTGGDPNSIGPGIPGGLDLGTGPRPPDAPSTSAPIPKKPVAVSEISQLALLIHKVEPTYPPLAKLTRREGTVQLHAVISRDGRVVNLEVMSGDILLARSASDAVGQWRFRPTILNGQPVEVETYITVVFRLGQ
jgi:protein TonB